MKIKVENCAKCLFREMSLYSRSAHCTFNDGERLIVFNLDDTLSYLDMYKRPKECPLNKEQVTLL